MLGPVKAPSFRLASRIANTLRAGHPVKDYGEFDACRLILICVPDDSIPGTVAELASAEVCWSDKSAVLYSASRGSSELSVLAARGASIASLTTIPGFHDSRYLVEGDKPAIHETNLLVANRERHCIAIERDLKPLYLTALTCTSSLLFPLMMTAFESLRTAGLTPTASMAILEKQLSKGLRAYARGGRRAYVPPAALFEQLEALTAADPALAHFIEESCRLTDRLLAEPMRAQSAVRKRPSPAEPSGNGDEQIRMWALAAP